MKKLAILLLLFFPFFTSAQNGDDYFKPDYLRFEDHTYVDYVKTALLENEGQAMSNPIISLNGTDKLRLQFDILDPEIMDVSYRIIHCDPDWKASVLSESDFIEGFYSDHITDYKHSMNTIQEYWHYELLFPNQQMKPVLSGNYLLIVFKSENTDSILLTRRFYVTEQLVEIQSNIHRATIIEYRNSHQEVDFKVSLKNLPVLNPYADIRVVITQNSDKNFCIKNLKPVFAANGELDYNYEEGNIFEGGNEFRNFDLRTTRFLTQYIEKFVPDSIGNGLTAVLKPDLRLSTQRYSSNSDLNGKFLNKIYDGREAALEGDYIKVNFRLKAPVDFTDNTIYLSGQFTDNALIQENRMIFNSNSGYFEKSYYIKQGYYDYRYIGVDKSEKVTLLETEGSHYETLNTYEFLVYWRAPGSRYDRLIGYKKTDAGGF